MGFGGGGDGFSPSQADVDSSTKTGGNLTQTHQFTGSVYITSSGTSLSASNAISASGFWGDGSGLTNTPAGSPAGSDTQVQYNNGGSFGAIASFTYNDSTGHLTVIDDKLLYFGTGNDASIEYDENGTDELIISGAHGGIDILVPIADAAALQIKDNDNTYLTVVTTANQQTVQANYGFTVPNNISLNFGSGQPPSKIKYDTTSARLTISGSAAGIAITGSMFADDIASGTVAGGGSFVGLTTNNQLVLSTPAGGGGSTNAGGSDTQLQYNDGGTAFGGVASLTYNDSTGDLTVIDDKKLYFGTNNDASIEYNEDSDNYMIISGSRTGLVLSGNIIHVATDALMKDEEKLYFGTDKDGYIFYGNTGGGNELAISCGNDGGTIYIPDNDSTAFQINETSNTYLRINSTNGQEQTTMLKTLAMSDDITLAFGSGQPPSTIHYDADGTDRLTISGSTAGINITGSVHLSNRSNLIFGNPITLTNDEGGGEVVYFGTGTLAAGALHYLNTDGGWAKAAATTTGSGNDALLGISLGTNPAVHGMLIRGWFDIATYYSGSFLKGKAIYIQSGSTGYMSGAAPSAADSYARIVGYATSTANVIYFSPGTNWVEIS